MGQRGLMYISRAEAVRRPRGDCGCSFPRRIARMAWRLGGSWGVVQHLDVCWILLVEPFLYTLCRELQGETQPSLHKYLPRPVPSCERFTHLYKDLATEVWRLNWRLSSPGPGYVMREAHVTDIISLLRTFRRPSTQ